jgi:AraC family transcriptional regulator
MKTFTLGGFYGAFEHRRRIGDSAIEDSGHAIELAELQPTVPEHEVEVHTHADAHFVLVLAGKYVSSAAGMPAVSAHPALIYNPPGTTHRDCFRGLAGRFFTVSIPADALAGRTLPQQALKAGAIAEHRILHVREELARWDDVSPLAVDAGIEAVLDGLQRRIVDTGDGPAWLARAHERLRDDCAHPPRMAELARLAGVHPVAFARAFRRRYGCTPGEYLRECRMDRAVALLRRRPRLALADVSARAGYADQAHFSRAFRESFGCTPSAYRHAS